MLAPRWELPLSRRGALALKAGEVNAIFGEAEGKEFEIFEQTRVARMNVPFKETVVSDDQSLLPGI